MTEAKTGVDWSSFRAAGLFREGVHSDTRVTAQTPDGKAVELNVVPVQVNNGQDTLFVAPPSEASSMTQIFPKEPTSCI